MCTQHSDALLRSLRRPLVLPPGIEPTLLFSTNSQVDAVNSRKLAALPKPEHVYEADDDGSEPFLGQVSEGRGARGNGV